MPEHDNSNGGEESVVQDRVLLEKFSGLVTRFERTLKLLSAVAGLSAVPVRAVSMTDAAGMLLDTIVSELQEVHGASILMYSAEDRRLRLLAARGQADVVGEEDGPYNEDLNFRSGEGEAGRAFVLQTPVFWNEGDYDLSAPDAWTVPRSLACLPLTTGGETLGVLNISFLRPRPFDHARRRDLMILGEVAGNILMTFELSEKLTRARDELQSRVVERTANLRQSESRYQGLFENAPVGIFRTTTGGEIIEFNPACARMFGFVDPDEARRSVRHLASQVYERSEDREAFVTELLREGRVYNYEIRFKRWDGSIFHGSVSARLVQDEASSPGYLEGFVSDVTDRRRAEEALRRSEQRYRSLFEAALDWVFIHDLEGAIMEVNPAAAEALGYSRDELESLHISRIVAPSLTWMIAEKTAELADGADAVFECIAVHRDGREIPVEVSARLIEYDGGDAVLAVVRDITERNRASEALVQAKEAAEQASRAKTELLAAISHELRTPLGPVVGLTETVLEDDLTPEQRANLELVLKSSRRLRRRIDDLIELSRLEAGRVDMTPHPMDLGAVVRALCEGMQSDAAARNLDLKTKIEVPAETYSLGNQRALEKILERIIGNAIKFTGPGGEIIVRAALESGKDEGRHFHLTVRDSGPGIPSSQLETIFESFRQGDGSSRRSHGGLGLGLAIAQRLARQSGGWLWLESGEGEGTAAHLRLPYTPWSGE